MYKRRILMSNKQEECTSEYAVKLKKGIMVSRTYNTRGSDG